MVVIGKRGEVVRLVACVVLTTTRADVNGLIRRHLNGRKASFGQRDETVQATAMEYGGITPIGLRHTGRFSSTPPSYRCP